jgi:hypothetical protein
MGGCQFTQLLSWVGESGHHFCTDGARKRLPPPDKKAPAKVSVCITLGVADTGRHALVPITASRG